MVSNEIWMDSGAMVSMIPEQDIYIGDFVSSTTASGKTELTLDTEFTNRFAFVPNLYIGCILEIYENGSGGTSDGTFHDKAVIIENTGNKISVADTLSIGSNETNYYGIIRRFGAPVPAPKASGTSTLQTATITIPGDNLLASQAIVANTAISGALSGSSTGAELTLTLSSQSGDITMAANASDGANYQTGFITIHLATATGDSTLGVVFDTSAGTTKAGSAFDDFVEVNVPDSATAIQIASAIQTALLGKDVTVSRSGAKLSISNNTGGYVNSGTYMTMEDSGGAVTDFGTLSADVDGGVVTAVTITNAGSSVSGSGNLTITSAAGTDAVLALAAGSSGNARLLSDTWIGLADSVTVPTTSVEMKQLNLASAGTRNYVYQFKGAESTDGGSINLFANNFTFLYYALGKQSFSVNSEKAVPNASGDPSDFFTCNASTNDFIYDTTTDNRWYRVINGDVCPPIRRGIDNHTNTFKSPSDTQTDFITYTYTEENGEELPSFALEYTLKKGSQNATVANDTAKENVYTKLYPGCQVNTLTITADEGQEIKMDVSLMTKTTVIAGNTYDSFNNKTSVEEFTNYGSRNGGASNVDATLMTPYFFSGGTIELFGNEYMRIQNCTITINNGLQDKRFIGRTNKRIKSHVTGQRTYELSFTGYVTDGAIFDELRNEAATALSGTTSDISLNFYKENGESMSLNFNNYMVKSADFPLTNDNSPISVTWVIEPLKLGTITENTYWVNQG